jgi:hypothetical protein
MNHGTFRAMELDAELFLQRHIDHGTFWYNFIKIPYEYFHRLLCAVAQLLEELLGYYITIIDSTGLSTRRFEDTLVQGEQRRVQKDYKLHVLAAYSPKERLTYYMDALATDKHVSDAAGATTLLLRHPNSGYHLGDRAYDAESVYEAILANEGIPIIKPKHVTAKCFSSKAKGRKMYREHIYKELRGVIETSFGGLENGDMIQTRCTRDDTIKKKGILAAFKHTCWTWLRIIAIQAGRLWRIIRQTRSSRVIKCDSAQHRH